MREPNWAFMWRKENLFEFQKRILGKRNNLLGIAMWNVYLMLTVGAVEQIRTRWIHEKSRCWIDNQTFIGGL